MTRAGTEPDGLQIRLLGELEVVANGRTLSLPQSKKTRALLGYLALTGRSHRRDRLCALLWDVADDPRAALRWSLSKLRELVDVPGQPRLIADREHASIELPNAYVDVFEVQRLLTGTPERASTANLEAARALFRGELLEGLELPDFHAYSAWCLAERKTWRDLHRQVVVTLLGRTGGHPDKTLPLVRELVHLDPGDDAARSQLLELLHATGRIREAEEQSRANRRLLSESVPPGTEQRSRPSPELRARKSALPEELPFVGRRGERERLSAWFHAARQDLRILLLQGDAGLGKSRLLRELTREAALAGARIVTASIPEARPGWPYAPFRELLSALVPADAELRLRENLSPLLSPGGALPEAAAGRDPLFRAALACIEQAAREGGPLVIVLDDAHWLDDASAELLHFVSLGLRGVRVDFLLSAREGELRDQAGIARALRALRREGLVDELKLTPLTRDETLQLVAPLAAEAAAAQLYEQSAGNPLFAIELARESQSAGKSLPSSISRLVRDRLDALSPEQSDVLRWLAVLGSQFETELLAQLVAFEPDLLVDALERLERYGWLELQPSAADHNSLHVSPFAHEIVQRAVYDQLSEPRRRLMHTRIARALAAGSDADGAGAAAVAHHAALGGDQATATRACLSAGKRCLRLYANADALRLARRGLSYAEALPDPQRTTLSLELLALSVSARRPSSVDEVMPQLVRLTSRALDLGAIEHARIGFHLRAFLTWEQGGVADAQHFSREVERISRLADPRDRVAALGDAARCLAKLERDLPEAEAFLLEAEAVAGDTCEQPLVVRVARGLLSLYRGELECAVSELQRARQLALHAGDRLEEFYVLEGLINLELARQQYAVALSFASELVTLAERLRSGSEAPFAHAAHALTRYAAGLDATPEHFDRALEPLVIADAKQRRSLLLAQAALFEQSRGAWPLAVAHAEEALRLAQLMERSSEAALALGVLVSAEVAAKGCASTARIEALRALLETPVAAHARKLAERALATTHDPIQHAKKEKRDGARHRRASVR